MRRYERLVFSVALRTGVNVADAADVTQSTFVALLESLDRVRDDEKLPAWLATVARRHAWKVRRRSALEFPQDVAPEPELVDEVSWDEIIDLQDALAALAAPCRDLLTALYFEPWQPSYAEIARRTGRSVGGIGPDAESVPAAHPHDAGTWPMMAILVLFTAKTYDPFHPMMQEKP